MTLPVRRHSACVLEIELSGVLRDDVDIELQGDELVVGPRACGTNPQPHYPGIAHSSLRDGTETDHDQP